MKKLLFFLSAAAVSFWSCCRDCTVTKELNHTKTYNFEVDSFPVTTEIVEFCKEERKEMDGKITRKDTIVSGLKMVLTRTYDCSKN